MDNPSQRNGLETLKCLGNVANTNIWPGNLNIWPGIMFTTRPRHWEVFIKGFSGLLMIIKWCHWILWEVPSLPKAELCISPSSPSLPPRKAQGCFFGANHSKGKNWPSIGSRCGSESPDPPCPCSHMLEPSSSPVLGLPQSQTFHSWFIFEKSKNSHCHYIINCWQVYKNLLVMLFQGTVSEIILIFLRFYLTKKIWVKPLQVTRQERIPPSDIWCTTELEVWQSLPKAWTSVWVGNFIIFLFYSFHDGCTGPAWGALLGKSCAVQCKAD